MKLCLGHLPVLFSTSTLSVGVNLPAHLVIIKSTDCYQNGVLTTAPISQIIQMIGRAGRPQFDTQAKAVIMVKNNEKEQIRKSLLGQQTIESCLHLNFLEHLNSEINMRTINCHESALRWMKSTFLYVRLLAEPQNYCLKIEPGSASSVNQFLTDILEKNFVALERLQLVRKVHNVCKTSDQSDYDLTITPLGSIMAFNNINFKTMESFMGVTAAESIHQLLRRVCSSDNVDSVVLRVEEKKQLNSLKDRIPYKLNMTKVKTADDKICVLVHATLVSLAIPEFTFQQDVNQIFRLLPRLGSALVQILEYKKFYMSLKNAYLLRQAFCTKLWHNSKFVSKLIPKIGQSSAELLVNGGYSTFQSIWDSNPRHIELVLNKHAPFGNNIVNFVKHIPKVSLQLSETCSNERSIINVTLALDNFSEINKSSQSSAWHRFIVIIGTSKNELIFYGKVSESLLKSKRSWSRSFAAPPESSIFASAISSTWCGVGDTACIKKEEFTDLAHLSNPYVSQVITETNKKNRKSQNTSADSSENPQACKHACKDKKNCAHSCCKVGIVSQVMSLPKSLNSVSENNQEFSGHMLGSVETSAVSGETVPDDHLFRRSNNLISGEKNSGQTVFQTNSTDVPAKKFSFRRKEDLRENYMSKHEALNLDSVSDIRDKIRTPSKRPPTLTNESAPFSNEVGSPSKKSREEIEKQNPSSTCPYDSAFYSRSTSEAAEKSCYFSGGKTEQLEFLDDDGISYSPLIEQDTTVNYTFPRNQDNSPECINLDFDDNDDEFLSCVLDSSPDNYGEASSSSKVPERALMDSNSSLESTVAVKSNINPLRILFPKLNPDEAINEVNEELETPIEDPDEFLSQFKLVRRNQINKTYNASSKSSLRNVLLSNLLTGERDRIGSQYQREKLTGSRSSKFWRITNEEEHIMQSKETYYENDS